MKPIFLYSKRFPFGKFTGITLFIFVITKMRYNVATKQYTKPILTERYKRHETYHAWQQTCLFLLGVFVAAIGQLFGASAWVWSMVLLLPLGTYVLCWFIEILLPPYSTAYKDICFEGEAVYNELNLDPTFVPFSFLAFVKNKDWKRLGEEAFG